jgi:hypothetical protein
MRLEIDEATGLQETSESDDTSMNCGWGAVPRAFFAASVTEICECPSLRTVMRPALESNPCGSGVRGGARLDPSKRWVAAHVSGRGAGVKT